jgi:hypothetical protein
LRVLFEHFAAATAALISRAAGGRGYDRADPDLQSPNRGPAGASGRARLPAVLEGADFRDRAAIPEKRKPVFRNIMPQQTPEARSIQFETIAL